MRTRHDLPPEKTSQVSRIGSGNISIGYQKVIPPVVIDVCKHGAPCPTTHRHSQLLACIAELSFFLQKESVAAGESKKGGRESKRRKSEQSHENMIAAEEDALG